MNRTCKRHTKIPSGACFRKTSRLGYISLIDKGLNWHLDTPSHKDRESKRRDGLQYRWSDYLNKICHIIVARHPDASLIFLVNDLYDIQFFIKDQ